MIKSKHNIIIYFFFLIMTNKVHADKIFYDNFQNPADWRYISDDVMGGVSKGSVSFSEHDGKNIALLSGKISTENNGGFIQIRKKIENNDLKNARYVKIIAKGNNQKYFIHLRTTGTILPWQYYAHDFKVSENFQEYILPIEKFKKSGSFLFTKINPKTIKSIAVVAFGRDHKAEIYIKEITITD